MENNEVFDEECKYESEETRKRKQQIKQYRQEQEKLLSSMTEEEQIAYMMEMLEENEKAVKKMGLKTISEDDING